MRLLHLLLFTLAAALSPRNPCAGSWFSCKFGGYTLKKKLGAGAFGQVWLATDAKQTQVAVKMIDANRNEDILSSSWPDTLRDLKLEVHLLRALSHPHILQYIDSFEERGWIGLVTELAERGTLENYLEELGLWPKSTQARFFANGTRAGKSASEAMVKQLLLQVGSALDFLTSINILHRDVKLDNVLVMKDGRFVLADVGIATVAREYTERVREAVGGVATDELVRRLSLDLIVDHGIDEDGDGVRDIACAALGVGASGESTDASCLAHLRAHRIEHDVMTGTYPYMAPEMRLRQEFKTKSEPSLSRYRSAVEDATKSTPAYTNAVGRLNALIAARNVPFTEKTDCFSLGASAFALMTGGELFPHMVPSSSEAIAAELPSFYSANTRKIVRSLLSPDSTFRSTYADIAMTYNKTLLPGSFSQAAADLSSRCSSQDSCRSCAEFGFCGWCSAKNTCLPLLAPPSSSVPTLNSGCPRRHRILLPSACDGK